MIPTDRNAPPQHWTSASLGEIALLITKGSTPTTYGHNYKSAGIPFIRVENLADGYIDGSSVTMFIDEAADETLKRSRLCSGDVLISIAGTIGRIALVRDGNVPANINQALAIIRGTDRVLTPLFLMHFLRSSAAHQRALKDARGGAMNNISLGDVARLDVPIPPKPEQWRIVAEIEKQITRLEAGVGALKRVQANLKRYRAAVLKAAVEGRLVPTEAELARREGRSYEPASELLARLGVVTQPLLAVSGGAQAGVPVPPTARAKKLIAPGTTDSPKLPEGWTWATFSQLIWYLRSGTSETASREVTEFPVLRSSAVRPGKIDFDDVNFLSEEQSTKRENYVRKGDLLITRLSGSVEYVGVCAFVATTPTKPLQYPDRLFCGNIVHGIDAQFVVHCFQHKPIREVLERAAKSTAGHQRISMSDLRLLSFPLPPYFEQRRIVAEVERRLSVIDELEMQVEANLKRAERLREAILKRAFEGKLVPQDPRDEPASMLLERIKDARA